MFADEKGRAGKRYVQMVDVELDFCQLTYSESPCAAILGTTGDHKCFNTFETCQDTANYDPAIKTYRFIQPNSGLPRTVDAYPLLRSIEFAPTRLDPGNSLGKRASITARFQDAPHHDRGIDKYVSERISGDAAADGSTYEPYEQGTFFGKLRARNPFYLGRKIHVYSGFIPWDHDAAPEDQPATTESELLNHLQKRTYIMERWEGPNSDGRFSIVAKDILKLADDDRAQAPAPSTGVLDADITAGDGAATLSPAGVGDDEYPASGRAKLSDEIVAFTRSGDTLTLTTRGDLNTEADDHDAGDTVQLIYEQESTKASAIVEDLLLNYADVNASFIDSSAWTNEDDTYIGRLFTGYVVEPTPVVQLINELSRQSGCFIYWDELDQEIRFKAIRQPDVVSIDLSDNDAFLEGTTKQREQPDKRRSQVWVYHGLIRPTDDIDKGKNYSSVFVLTESAKEAENAYGRKAIQKVYARWIPQTNRSAAEDVANRIMSRFQDPPRRVEFTLPGSQSALETGLVFNATTRLIQNERGEKAQRRMIALSKEPTGDAQYRIDAEEFLFAEADDAGVKRVIVSSDTRNFNLRDAFDAIFTTVTASDEVECEIETNVIVGSESPADPAFEVGEWPTGTTITLVNNGDIRGSGGKGGSASSETISSENGADGGAALFTRFPLTLTNNNVIAGGGGGGGGGASSTDSSGTDDVFAGGGGGGAGAGDDIGGGGVGGSPDDPRIYDLVVLGENGGNGALTTGGAGGDGATASSGGSTATGSDGGDGGGTATAGSAATPGGSGGAAGNAIDGDSHVTYDTTGTIQGAQVN